MDQHYRTFVFSRSLHILGGGRRLSIMGGAHIIPLLCVPSADKLPFLAFASTSKGSSTGACPKRLFGKQIGWTGAVMGHRYFFYAHLLIMLRSLAPVNSSLCDTRAHTMQDTQFVTWSQKPFDI